MCCEQLDFNVQITVQRCDNYSIVLFKYSVLLLYIQRFAVSRLQQLL